MSLKKHEINMKNDLYKGGMMASIIKIRCYTKPPIKLPVTKHYTIFINLVKQT